VDHSLLANAIRFLAIDAVEKAQSGHPGAPMGMADIATVLWREFLQHNPADPQWLNRDRFVLSNGHGSMLIYSLLHLTGYDVSLDDLKNFRTLNSKTAGHPEYGHCPGVETTTGPLGQGLANGVGMALAQKTLAAQFNQPGHDIVDHYTYVFLGDGCLMEGISHEVASLAGRLQLGKLICFYDDNNISIDGEVGGWFADDTPKRFEAYNWHVIAEVDGHDPEQIRHAIQAAQANQQQATLICCRTKIGYGSPNKSESAASHGSPLGEQEVVATRKALSWPYQAFEIPTEVRAGWDGTQAGQQAQDQWQQRWQAYADAYPVKAQELQRRGAAQLPENWAQASQEVIKAIQTQQQAIATRKASQNCIKAFAALLPEFLGGSADLTGSNNTNWQDCTPLHEDPAGNYLYYGVREFGMSAMMNGIALHGGFLPFGGTFLVFMDYARNAVRMAALMQQRVVFVYTHDSIGLGEDGPTHQPVEHLASLRALPGMESWRPCDGAETAVAWQQAIERQGPSALILSRQTLPAHARSAKVLAQVSQGGYVLRACDNPQLVLMASGSEVALITAAAQQLEQVGIGVQVVSIPCLDRFLEQSKKVRDAIVPPHAHRLAVEAGIGIDWYPLVGEHGKVLCMTSFGASAAGSELFKHFGFTTERVVAMAQEFEGLQP